MKPAHEHYENAVRCLKNGQYGPAIPELRQSLALVPNHRESIFNLGFCLLEMDNYEEALNQFRRMLQLNPDDVLAYNSIGRLYRQKATNSHSREDWNSAQEAFQQALVLSPNDANILNDLAYVMYELEKFAEAWKTLVAAIVLAPKDRRISHNLDAIGSKILRKYVSQKKWKEAWKFWRMVVECSHQTSNKVRGRPD